MEYKTRISKLEENDVNIRGQKLSTLIETGKFTDTIFLLLTARKPTEKESILFEKVLISIIDHGMGTTSSMAARFVVSGGNPLTVGVAAGISSIGDFHGGAIEKAMGLFYAREKFKDEENIQFIKERIQEKKILYGFGHRHYKNGDFRVKVLIQEMEKIGYHSKYLKFKELVENTFEEVKGKKLHINVDGLIAILLCDFGFPPLIGKGIFAIGRTPGLVAHSYEQMCCEKPVRRISEEDITYLKDVPQPWGKEE